MTVANSSRRILGIRKTVLVEDAWFYLFIMPWLLGFLLFTAGPMIASVLISFMRWELVQPPQWVGALNWATLGTDPLFFVSLRVTLWYTLLSVPTGLAASFALALLMNLNVRGVALFRTLYYLPSIVSGVAVALLWTWILNPKFGLVNYLLHLAGIAGPEWLFSRTWVIPAFAIMNLWGVGGSMMIYLAGLQSIPTELYEAAEIDGAGRWCKLWHVTVPMMSPVVLFNLVMGVIGSMQVFTQGYVMTKGGPNNASLFYVLYLYRNAFQYFQMGYASALAWVLFGMIAALTALIFRGSRDVVYYQV